MQQVAELNTHLQNQNQLIPEQYTTTGVKVCAQNSEQFYDIVFFMGSTLNHRIYLHMTLITVQRRCQTCHKLVTS